jgi:hypothetical protein
MTVFLHHRLGLGLYTGGTTPREYTEDFTRLLMT